MINDSELQMAGDTECDRWKRFGHDATFVTTKLLVTNAISPEFARCSDRLNAGLSVTNNTEKTGNLTIRGELTGTVTFGGNGRQTTSKYQSRRSPSTTKQFPSTDNSGSQFTTLG